MMQLELLSAPLVSLSVDAIVNRANIGLQCARGLCAEIFDAAGKLSLQRACIQLGSCSVGEAVITAGFALPARYIIHAVPPRWCGGKHGEDRLLADCYRNALRAADRFGLRSIAFPLLSDSDLGYPTDRGLCVAQNTLQIAPEAEGKTLFLVL